MKNFIRVTAIAIACSIAASAYASPIETFSAKRGDVYAAKKAACKKEARGMKFGVHFVQRNRWIKDCIAGHKS